MTTKEVCDNIRDFFLFKIDDLSTLKNTHAYYAQVQGQLLITGCSFCVFVVYTQKDLFVQRIQPDLPSMTLCLIFFFKTYAKALFANQNGLY